MQEHAIYCCGLFLEEWLMVNSMKIKIGKMIYNLGGEMLTSQCIKFHSLQISQKDITYWIVCFFVWSILSFFDSVIIVTIDNMWVHTR